MYKIIQYKYLDDEMVDMKDLESFEQKCLCRFESGSGY